MTIVAITSGMLRAARTSGHANGEAMRTASANIVTVYVV
jgi:hypothetical protein